MCEVESCLTLIYGSQALTTSPQPSSDNSTTTTLSKPSRCQVEEHTLVGKSHSLWLQMCGKKLTANSIFLHLLSFEGPTVKHLIKTWWLGFLANGDDRKANKQVLRVSPNVLWRLCNGQGGRAAGGGRRGGTTWEESLGVLTEERDGLESVR